MIQSRLCSSGDSTLPGAYSMTMMMTIITIIIIIIMYIYHAPTNALSAYMLHINLNMIHVQQSYQDNLHKVLL